MVTINGRSFEDEMDISGALAFGRISEAQAAEARSGLSGASGVPGAKPDADVPWPGLLPQFHTHEQWQEHQRNYSLWEAQQAKPKGNLQESAGTLTGGRVNLQESTAVAPVLTGSGKLRVTLITPGWGTSCHYSAAVLEAAARDKIWAAGTQCFADHPTQRDLNDRPERSVRDLAAVLTSDARWDGSGLVAEAQLMPGWKDTLGTQEMARAIGMSIRASADLDIGEAEGRRGRIATRIVEGQSVDFVTRAGRGGSYSVIESGWNRW